MSDEDSSEYKVTHLLSPHDTSLYLSKEGPLAKISKDFEERKSQIELLTEITEAFNANYITAYEAGTGVGKSFAYLIPSMLWSLANQEKVVISTGTINLQQQLSQKDIPAAEKIIGKKVKAILLKGRQNFICRRRMNDLSSERDLFDTELQTLDRIAEWVKTTSTGSRSEVTFEVSDNLWARVNSESDACMGLRCPFREKCFVMKVRDEAESADILVVNHHLLFADIEARMNGAGYEDQAVLPAYKRIVFDEAHGIESAATSFFSTSVNRFAILKKLNLLYRQRKSTIAGYIFTLQAMSNCPDETEHISSAISEIKNNIMNLEIASLDLLHDEYSMKIDSRTQQKFQPVISLLLTLGNSLMSFTGIIRQIMEGIDEDNHTEGAYWETKSILRHLEDIACACKNFSVWEEKNETVFWIQKQRLNVQGESENPYYVTFTQTPLDISKMMNAGVYEPMASVVHTSATLQINNTFDFFLRRTGISYADKDRVKTGFFASPFPYKENVLLAVPDDIPFPQSLDYQSYVNKSILKLVKASGGRTLVLFTSYESMKAAYSATKTYISDMGIELFKQGDDDRFRLLDRFKNDDTSVLFATDSFWQGVDVPGSSLSQVIIVKLPFTVPNDPVFSARCELIEKRGGSSFAELSVPEAIIKFRQGFGRLVRRSTDKGAVIVLDKRLTTKPYGKKFIDSLPETKRMYAHFDEIVEAIRELLSE
ncbi:ATP-dependent DNA helicase [Treponema sp.]|uniref:ATP-dependent DNA helicase n=1 Tax=Treponema sp. TaxID=166 RepID=UPI00298DC32D|nr:helicase C-terminal domain-containing protein [Treponema sp.]MCR5612113.1 helicase [Treponema sp.]